LEKNKGGAQRSFRASSSFLAARLSRAHGKLDRQEGRKRTRSDLVYLRQGGGFEPNYCRIAPYLKREVR
jgi:hypothetical protein